jgi:23S rRNA G2445 N2-methylase RlmL
VALAEVLVRLAKPGADDRVLDPCCGAGTVLVAAGLSGVGQLLGRDLASSAIDAARTNLRALGLSGDLEVGDAADIRLPAGSVQRMISNLPFGKRVGSHDDNRELYPRLMAATERTLTPDGRAVYLTEDKRLLLDAVQRTPGLKIIRQRLLQYSGASPTAYVIGRNRRNGRRTR